MNRLKIIRLRSLKNCSFNVKEKTDQLNPVIAYLYLLGRETIAKQ